MSSAGLEGCAPRGVGGQCSLPSTQRGQTPMARAGWYDASGRKRRAAVPQQGLLAPPLHGRSFANSTNFM